MRIAHPVSICALSLAAAAQTGAPSSPIKWRSEIGRIARAEHPEPARELREIVPPAVTRRVFVRFDRPLTDHARSVWAAAGLELEAPLGSNGYFARAKGSLLQRAPIERLPGLVDAAEIQLEWKLHPTLFGGETPSWTRVEREGGEMLCAVYVALHPGADMTRDGVALVRQLGGRTVDRLESIHGLVCEIPRSRVSALAESDGVQWVEPALPRMEGNTLSGALPNDSNRIITQANIVHAPPYNLDGSGVGVLVYDGGYARGSHQDFSGRLTARDSSGQSNHATHVSGTIAGDGSSSGGQSLGMAPGATVESYGFEYNGSSIFLYHNPGDFETDYDQAMNVHGVTIANNSIGTNTESNGFECVNQGDYGLMSSLIDAVVRGSLGSPYRVVWAAGNERQGSRCDVEGFGEYYSSAPPNNAKNQISVGALNSNDDSVTSFTSWGPSDDGRLRPDVSAPGCEVGSDGGVTSAGSSSDSALSTLCGTSMASPTVCGLSALLLQDYRVQFPATPDPRNSTLKALLAHSAHDGGNVGPDYQYGYGSVRIRDAIDLMREGNFFEGTLDDQGSFLSYTVTVGGVDPELKLTLSWDDVPGTVNVRDALVNDLDLVVCDPLGGRHYPWTLDPGAPASAAVKTAEDHLNNTEQVQVTAPMAGVWTVELRATSLPGGEQPFSLVSSHALDEGPSVQIGFPAGLPSVLTPGSETSVTVRIEGRNDSVTGTPMLHFRYAGGAFQAWPLSPVTGDLWTAFLPAPVCAATPEFYVSAEGAVSGTHTAPSDAPGDFYTALVFAEATVFADDFETDQGWSVVNEASLSDGPWERATPAGLGDRGDPTTDYDQPGGQSGQCYLTDNVAGNSDVDGVTRLLSPSIDMSAPGDYYLSYARWFTNNDWDIDTLDVEIRNTGSGAWTLIEALGNDGGWSLLGWRVNDFVTPTATVQLRFSVTDDPNDSISEAAIDAVRVVRRTCPTLEDCNANGIADAYDISSGLSPDVDSNGIPDECSPPQPPDNPTRPGRAPGAGGTVEIP